MVSCVFCNLVLLSAAVGYLTLAGNTGFLSGGVPGYPLLPKKLCTYNTITGDDGDFKSWYSKLP